MRFYTFEYENQVRLGVQWKTQLVDVVTAYRVLLERSPPKSDAGLRRLPADLLRVLELGPAALEATREALNFGSRRPALPVGERLIYSFEEINLRPPLPHSGKILCAPSPSDGGWFAKMPSAVIGRGDRIRQPCPISQLHCQARLGGVIANRTQATAEALAMNCIAGFTILNDISGSKAGDLQPDEIFINRNFDTFCPLGPCMITMDELLESENRKWRMILNGETVQNGMIGEAIASLPKRLQDISKVMTLEAGDIIGIALSRESAISAKTGDRIGIEIDGIGILENHVVEASKF